ncbi:MAG: type II toxin-antitoxin system Phd/YefM family antitoxin [Actinomycetota bacterium]|nr:type II toxin-antitoxin system Phd/YefM family antitoxin [Actinomycetota bacterium]
MSVKILPSSEVRDHISTILKELSQDKKPVFITQYSRPRAVLVDIDQYNYLVDLLEDLEDINDFRLAEKEAAIGFDDFIASVEGKASVPD